MTHSKIGFIGAGRVVRIILEGWKRQGKTPDSIIVSDPNLENLSRLKSLFPAIETTSDNTRATTQNIVFLAVHPPALPEVLSGIKGVLSTHTVLVSMAPKFTLAKLSELSGGSSRVARVIPNAPSAVNAGFNPMSFSDGIMDSEKAVLKGLFEPLGACPEVEESKLEAYAVISAMGPTYFWFQFQALREIGMGFGLSGDEVSIALKQMVGGALTTLTESGMSPSEVMDLIPVKPLTDMESSVLDSYKTRLPGIYNKIKP
jgi:pyrroline-5-carboxylate reductase